MGLRSVEGPSKAGMVPARADHPGLCSRPLQLRGIVDAQAFLPLSISANTRLAMRMHSTVTGTPQ
jgi:hypothetical protein